MLLLHQVGTVKIGEVVRYTVTYTPSHDRILPSPEHLHLRVRNTSAIPLRAAFVHGPYTLSVAAYPSHFDPNTRFENPRRYGVPEFEPMLKAAGSWACRLVVPDNIREHAGDGAARGDFASPAAPGESPRSATWIVEIASQVIFSASAAVGFEVLLARDEKSLNLNGIPVIGSQANAPQPGRVADFQQSAGAHNGRHPAQPKGVFSKALSIKVEDTASLWNTPSLPGWQDWTHGRAAHAKPGKDEAVDSVVEKSGAQPAQPAAQDGSASSTTGTGTAKDPPKRGTPKKVHLVILTHGLHSNLGSDMLYLKESIDATVKQAKIDARARRARERAERMRANCDSSCTDKSDQGPDPAQDPPIAPEEEEEYDDEETIVRGFSGNATRTERGIKFLGKRLARFVLSMTYPDQPFLPTFKKAADNLAETFKGEGGNGGEGKAHAHSTIHKGHPSEHDDQRAFQITSISFVGHSLGGLVQTYAIAYIQKHSPQFFHLIRPINFVAMASPLLGLSNENPLYVKFALDSGLVGRTGKDLGLTWRAPTLARSGWDAIVGTLGESAHKKVMGDVQPASKPLLRILPTGPAHTALKKFRNRTLYSNVVNDGIVPLRTSCLLFLDWQGLGRVEKARREAGLVETMVGFGWAELTGASGKRALPPQENNGEQPSVKDTGSPANEDAHADSREVPQPPSNATVEDERRSVNLARTPYQESEGSRGSQTSYDFPFSGIFNFFKSSDPNKNQAKANPRSPRETKIYKRSQTLRVESPDGSASSSRSRVTTGQELAEVEGSGASAPPRTSVFEAAGDLLNPVIPSMDFLLDPAQRPRTIFHDRIYHPSDIPPPPLKKRTTGRQSRRMTKNRDNLSSPKPSGSRTSSVSPSPLPSPKLGGVDHQSSELSKRDYDDTKHTNPEKESDEVIDSSGMKVEEKIARAYHRDLSWRKVLVKLEPDAHNNIVVRRMFVNAHGWPVIKHLCDTHFSDSAAARTRDEEEASAERTKPLQQAPDDSGAETKPKQDVRRSSSDTNFETSQTDGSDDHRSPPSKPHGRTASEAIEARDVVPEMQSPSTERRQRLASHSSTASGGSNHSGSPPRPDYDRGDSVTWSERDWADSGDESETEMNLAYGGYGPRLEIPFDDAGRAGSKADKAKSPSGRTGSPVWNWTEKIVGRGNRRGSKTGQGSDEHSPSARSPSSQHGNVRSPRNSVRSPAELSQSPEIIRSPDQTETPFFAPPSGPSQDKPQDEATEASGGH